MPKVLLHNLTSNYRRYNPAVFNFDQNALFFAEPGDIVATRERISETYLSFLKKIGFKFDAVVFVASESASAHSPTSIFKNEKLVNKIRSLTSGSKDKWIFDSYMLTEWEADFANKIGIRFEGNASHYYYFGNKSVFRTLARKYHLAIPAGFENQAGVIDGAIAALRLFLSGFREVVIKQDEGVAGLSSKRLTPQNFFPCGLRLDKLFPKYQNWGVTPRNSAKFVVEGWYDDAIFSPSAQLYIDCDGKVSFISMHRQLFSENEMTYRGCTSWHFIPEKTRRLITEETTSFAGALAAEGFRGYISLDGIILKNGDVLWIEINPRRIMSSYPFQIVNRITDGDPNSLHYVSKRIRKSEWLGQSIEYILDKLSPILYSVSSRSGVIPYDFGLLESAGEMSVMIIGKNPEEIDRIISYI